MAVNNTTADFERMCAEADMVRTPDGWAALDGLYGVVRGRDGLLRAAAAGGVVATEGVDDETASRLVLLFCPVAAEVRELLHDDDRDGALLEARNWVRAWNQMARGETENTEFHREHHGQRR